MQDKGDPVNVNVLVHIIWLPLIRPHRSKSTLFPSISSQRSILRFQAMILLQSPSRFLLQILQDRVQSPEKGVDLDCHSVEFDDVRYHIQVSMKKPQVMVLSVSLPTPPPEAVFYSGLPVGAIEAIKAAYGPIVQILDPPKDGYNLTMKLYLSKLPPNEGSASFLSKVIMSFCYE